MTTKVKAIVKYAKILQGTVAGEYEDRMYEISISDLYYAEAVDKKTYLYTKDRVYASGERLYELEEMLSDASFVRISKSVLVNLMKITAISPALNGRFQALLSNGEEVIISRKYVPEFKEKIRGGKRI